MVWQSTSASCTTFPTLWNTVAWKPSLQSIKPAFPKSLTSLMMVQENRVSPMKRSWEAKDVTSQITLTVKAKVLLRITSAMPPLSTDTQSIPLKTGWKQRSVSYVERQRAIITRFTTLTNSKISKARNGGKSQWLPNTEKRLWCAGIATAVLSTKSEFCLNEQ